MATSFVELAQEIIADLAVETDAETSMTFKTVTYTRANPWKAPTASSPTTQTITGFAFPPGTRRFNGELVPENQRLIYIAAADLTDLSLGVDTTVTIGAQEFSTLQFNKIPEGDNPALLEIFVDLG